MKTAPRLGQGNATILVAVLAALIVLYIIFLPSDARLDAIGDNESIVSDRGDSEDDLLVLDEGIIMDAIDRDEKEIDLPSVNLFTRTGAEVIRSISSARVVHGLFEEEDYSFDFKLDDPDNTDAVLLTFFAKTAKGPLTIEVNNHNVYTGEIEKVNVDPIRIPSDLLAETNTLRFSVGGVGAAFWRTNEYLMENVQLTADITDTSAQESTVSFFVRTEEIDNVEEAELLFIPDCDPIDVQRLEVLVNGNPIYSSVPDCDVPYPQKFSPRVLRSGENTLTFSSTQSRYLIDRVKVTLDFREQPSYTYFFDIDDEEFNDIRDDDLDVNLTLYFTDDEEDKEAEIIINDRKLFMTRHDDFEWSVLLSRYVERGSNSLKIIPEERLEIRRLEVRLDEP